MSMKTTALILGVTLAALTGVAFAQDDAGVDGDREKRPGHHRGPGSGFGDPAMMIERMSRHLDLDENQQQSIDDILDASKPEFEALRDRARANREAVQALDAADPDYGVMLQDLSAKSGELAAGLTLLTGRIRGEIAAVLTDEQRAVLEEKMLRTVERRRHLRPDRVL